MLLLCEIWLMIDRCIWHCAFHFARDWKTWYMWLFDSLRTISFLQMITFILLSTLISFFPLNLPSIKHLSPVVHLWETTNKWGKLKRQSYGNKAPPTQNIPRLVSNPQVVLCCALIILKRLENHGKHLLIMTLDTLDHYESHLFGHLLQGNRKTPVCMHYRSRELLQIPLCVCALGGQFSSK